MPKFVHQQGQEHQMPHRGLAAAFLAPLGVLAVIGMVSAEDVALVIDPGLSALAPDAMVSKRQAIMKEDGGILKQAGKLSGDEAIAAADKLIANLSALTVLFPKETDIAGSEALPAVWERYDEFQTILHKGVASATEMKVAATAGDAAAYGASLKAIGGLCGQCHQQFRAD